MERPLTRRYEPITEWLAANGYRSSRLPIRWELLQPMLHDTVPNAAVTAAVGKPGIALLDVRDIESLRTYNSQGLLVGTVQESGSIRSLPITNKVVDVGRPGWKDRRAR